jgi:hypothetical protein
MTRQAITPLGQRMIEDMEIRRLAAGAQAQYLSVVARFARQFGRFAGSTRLSVLWIILDLYGRLRKPAPLTKAFTNAAAIAGALRVEAPPSTPAPNLAFHL